MGLHQGNCLGNFAKTRQGNGQDKTKRPIGWSFPGTNTSKELTPVNEITCSSASGRCLWQVKTSFVVSDEKVVPFTNNSFFFRLITSAIAAPLWHLLSTCIFSDDPSSSSRMMLLLTASTPLQKLLAALPFFEGRMFQLLDTPAEGCRLHTEYVKKNFIWSEHLNQKTIPLACVEGSRCICSLPQRSLRS